MNHSTTANPPATKLVKRSADVFGTAAHGKVGMWMFLITDAMSFSGLLIAYAVLRARTPTWPVPEQYLGIALSAFATFLLICSSVTMVMAQAAGEVRDSKKMLKFLLLTAAGGIGFLCIQAHEFNHLAHEMGMIFTNFFHGPPQFASTFYIVTGFHGLHVTIGVIYLLVISFMTWRGRFDDGNVDLVEICGLFWHFVDLIWILVFTFIYLI